MADQEDNQNEGAEEKASKPIFQPIPEDLIDEINGTQVEVPAEDVLVAAFEALLTSAETHAEATTRAKQVAFLTALAIHGTVMRAALEAHIHRDTHYNWLDKDELYAKAFRDAEAIFADQVRDEVRRRAVDGWLEPVFYMGIATGIIRKKSDRLLELLAKAKCPEFREKHEITGEGGGPIKVVAVRFPVKEESAEEWQKKFGKKAQQIAETDKSE